MSIKETLQDSKNRMDALLDYANGVTGQEDASLGDAVKTLCDGYGQGGGGDIPVEDSIYAFYLGEARYFKTNEVGFYPFSMHINVIGGKKNLVYFSARNMCKTLSSNGTPNTAAMDSSFMQQATKLEICIWGNYFTGLAQQAFTGTPSLKTIVTTPKRLVSLTAQSFGGSGENTPSMKLGTCTMYVPDLTEAGESLPALYKTAANWSEYADHIKGYSEAPTFDTAVTYEIGDVCQYNGCFYAYCNKALTPAAGKLPSGNHTDTQYWEFIDYI